MIISFASSKGGAGKSTTCACVSAELAREGASVLLIDLDQNRTLHRWATRAPFPGLTVVAPDPDAFPTLLRDRQATGAYDHICIDLPGARERTLYKALGRSDLVVIPAQASEPDLREAMVIVSDIKDVAEEIGREVPYRLLLTKLFSLRTRVTDYAYAQLEKLGLPLFRTGLVERAAYREMFLTGEPPTVSTPDKGAGLEIRQLVDEIKTVVANTTNQLKKAG